MISNPGDNRTALIAALIAIPAAVVVSMAVHTFVPGQEKPSLTVIAGAEAPQGEKMSRSFKGPHGQHGHHAPGKEMPGRKFSKEDFKKRFMAIRAERVNTLKKVVELSKKRMELLAKQQGACPKAVLEAERDYLLAESAMYRQNARIRFEGASVSELAVKAIAAEKIAAACDKIGFKAYVFAEDLEEAVKICRESAQEGDCCLLSPACASWGMFKNYQQRGDMFKALVRGE